jgi:hypothetical protein
VRIAIDNSSVFIPGDNAANAQFGFRRTELIAQSPNRSAFEVGTTVFHVSIMEDLDSPLNFKHEYQLVFVEPSDGSHVFEIQLGMYDLIPFFSSCCKLKEVTKTDMIRHLIRCANSDEARPQSPLFQNSGPCVKSAIPNASKAEYMAQFCSSSRLEEPNIGRAILT